jgi:dTDP-4-amino-4,6-dideoxygalactose transaminase
MLRCTLSGKITHGPDVKRLVQWSTEFFSGATVIPYSSGRVAIEMALRAARIPKGAEVVVPTFCCASVITPILAVGAEPVLADVGDELNLTAQTLEAALSSRTRAVIVPHLFGNPADIDAIRQLVRGREIILIDDAAQALGATIGGVRVGSLAEAGVVSFGNGKVCFGTGGGLLILAHREMVEQVEQLPLPRSAAFASFGHALSIVFWRRWRRWSLPLRVILSRLGLFGEEQRSYPRQAMANLDAAVALTLLEKLAENLRARRERVLLYSQLISDNPAVRSVPHRAGSACLKQVIEVIPGRRGAEVHDLIKLLRHQGFEVENSYTPLHILPQYRSYRRGSLKTAERLWQTLIELPCEPSVSLSDVRKICEVL